MAASEHNPVAIHRIIETAVAHKKPRRRSYLRRWVSLDHQ